MRNLFAWLWLAMGAGWGVWIHRRLLASRRTSLARRFLVNWLATTCYFLGLGGWFVLENDGRHRGRGPAAMWRRWHWSEALVEALILGALFGALGTLTGWGKPDDSEPSALGEDTSS